MLKDKLVCLGFAVVLSVVMAGGHASAAVATYDVTNSGYDAANNWWVYSYILENPASAPDSLFWFELTGLAGDLGPEPVPEGWTLFLLGSDADWIADFGSEVVPGAALPEFAFHSTARPGTVSYEVFGDGGSDYQGTVVGPTPELSSVSLLLLGMLPVGLAWRRRRRA